MLVASTPQFVLRLPSSVDLSNASDIYFSIKQGNVNLKKHGSVVVLEEPNVVSVELSQVETLMFYEGWAFIQLNWIFENGKRGGSKKKKIWIDDNILREEITV